MTYLPILWIALLALAGIASGQNIYGWLVTALFAFLIYPKFWERLEGQGRNTRHGLRVSLAVLYTVFFGYAVVGKATGGPQYGTPEYIIDEAKAEVAAKLKDPTSAQFSDVRISDSGAVCGKVNGKNSFGAYNGSVLFVDIPVSSKGFNAARGEMGAFVQGEGASFPSDSGLQTTDFYTLYGYHCLGMSYEKQAQEKAEFMQKFGKL